MTSPRGVRKLQVRPLEASDARGPAADDSDFRVRGASSRPGYALGVAITVWLASSVAAAASGDHDPTSWLHWISGIAGTVTALSAAALVVRRARVVRYERDVWGPMAVAAVALAAAFVVETIFGLGYGSSMAMHIAERALPLDIAGFVACAFVYWGVVQWNRFSTVFSDPADWLNGLSSVFALVATGNLVVHWSGSAVAHWPWWQLQLWLFGVSAAAVVVGAIPTVAALAGLVRDPRPWMLGGALILIGWAQFSAVHLTSSSVSFGTWSQLGWLLALITMASTAVWRPMPARPQAATAMSTTFGTVVVLAASVIVLAADSLLDGKSSRLAALYAVIAFVGASTQAVRIIRDLSQLAQIRHEARTDELTGTANRRALMTQLHTAIADRGGACLLIVDLDKFKEVNDRYGHVTGDELLRQMSRRLEEMLPANGLLARLGGDEFAILLVGSELPEAKALAAALVAGAGEVTVIDGYSLIVGASVGIATQPQATANSSLTGGELLRRADVAMYVAKRDGASFSVYDTAVDVAAQQQLRQLEELRTILGDDATVALREQLVMHYQPLLDARSRSVVGVEALVRWQHPEFGLLGPDAFLEMVERDGLMGRLTAHVLFEATEQAARWQALGHPLRIAVNLSTSSLSDPDLLPMIQHCLGSSGLLPTQLTVEITETTLMTDPERSLRTTRQLVATGVRVSIDDYGTGYSSLAYLNDLPATELKIDRYLTARIVADKRTAAIVAATVELAHRLGLRVIAEGVEDEETYQALRALDCDEVQGYLFARPGPAATMDAWLMQHQPVAL